MFPHQKHPLNWLLVYNRKKFYRRKRFAALVVIFLGCTVPVLSSSVPVLDLNFYATRPIVLLYCSENITALLLIQFVSDFSIVYNRTSKRSDNFF